MSAAPAGPLPTLLTELHKGIQQRLTTARIANTHSVAKGDASEDVWLDLFRDYLPQRYQAAKAQVVDSKNACSDQIDIVIYDRQYSPLIFRQGGGLHIPAESVYAVFEAKQTINAYEVKYAQNKVASVRRLHRTSLDITHAASVDKAKAKPLIPILGGILSLESTWKPALGAKLVALIEAGADQDTRLDLGCVAAHGMFGCRHGSNACEIKTTEKAATVFLFELIARLQNSGTVPMIDTNAYAAWL